MKSKNIIVTGASGFIGGHLVRYLKQQGHTVHGMDIMPPLYEEPTHYYACDLRKEADTEYMFSVCGAVDEVYNLACLMGGMGFIGDPIHDYDVMVGSSRIVANVLECSVMKEVQRSFYSSSACVYNMNKQNNPYASLAESAAYPAMPDLVYGWQKLFSEQMYFAALVKGLDIRIARFHNIFGPEGTFDGGKEKAPAAICRKVAMAKEGEAIQIWGNGKQTRTFLYVSECIEAVTRLMESDFTGPVNVGSDERISIEDLAEMVIDISGKKLTIQHVDGPVGVTGRSSNNYLIKDRLGWAPSAKLKDGLIKTYEWINEQVKQLQVN